MNPFARIVLSPVLAVLTGSCRVMFRMAVIVGLLCNGCATIPEHPSTSIGKCAQNMRIFDVRLADKVVDATSYEEVEGILGLPTNHYGSGVVYNQWVFENGEVYRLFTSMFIHFGIEHLAGNMLALYIFGKIAEGAVGHVRYLIFYLVSGLGASLCSCVFNMIHDTNTISGGASGAIYGVMGMVLAMLIVSSKRSATMEVLKVRMGIMVVFMVFDGMSMAGVDWVAHLGGLVVGLLVTLAFRDRKKKLF